MMGRVLLSVLACAAVCHASIFYAGFNHLVNIDDSGVASAFDYRRGLPIGSTCDVVGQPPLVADAELQDWLTLGAKEVGSSSLTYTYLGYEIFLVENKLTGSYVARRCRDFRPQLTSLPCEVFATGSADKLKAPFKTVHIGNDRVMIVNTMSSEYTIHPFDADVHTGGDPFAFTAGAVFSGVLPITELTDSEMTYVQLKEHGGDVLLFHRPGAPYVQGFRFNGASKKESEFEFTEVLRQPLAAGGLVMGSLGEDQVMFTDSLLNYITWEVYVNASRVVSRRTDTGNFNQGRNCMYDNATACVLAEGCGWCPSTYTCHNYDTTHQVFCDGHACTVGALSEKLSPDAEVVVPDCQGASTAESEHTDIFDVVDAGYDALPGHVRLSSDYRGDVGAHSHVEASPIHPAIDNELGDDPLLIDDEFPASDVIHENNKVAQGKVYLPPPPSAAAPCMDADYDHYKGADFVAPAAANRKMNEDSNLIKNAESIPTSPEGDATQAKESADCARTTRAVAEAAAVTGNTTSEVSVNATDKVTTVAGVTLDEFTPRRGDPSSTTEVYSPSTTTPMNEEDTMNGGGVMAAKWLDDITAEPVPSSPLSPERMQEDKSFRPKNGGGAVRVGARPPSPIAPLRVAGSPVAGASGADLMNQGLPSEGLAGADCTEDGGSDGVSSASFSSAMSMSARKASLPSLTQGMPKTIEEHLAVIKDELVDVKDEMSNGNDQEPMQLAVHLPEKGTATIGFVEPVEVVRVGDM